MKKYIFWHIGNIGNGIAIAKEQYQLLLDSNLLSNVDGLKIGIAGNNSEFISSISNDKTSIVVQANLNEFESQTSRKMVEFAKSSEDCYMLFIHNKGSSKYGDEPTYSCTQAWRKYMEYFLIERWQDAISKLDNGFDSCGVDLRFNPLQGMHYSGAFFWIKSSILKQINPENLSLNSRWGRFCTEAIPSMVDHKRHCFFNYNDIDPNIGLYTYKAKREDYIK